LIQEKKESRIRGKTTKMISDRGTRKMARFLPLLKKRRKKNTGTAEAVNSIADTKKRTT
jgi:hypothetical protein